MNTLRFYNISFIFQTSFIGLARNFCIALLQFLRRGYFNVQNLPAMLDECKSRYQDRALCWFVYHVALVSHFLLTMTAIFDVRAAKAVPAEVRRNKGKIGQILHCSLFDVSNHLQLNDWFRVLCLFLYTQ
jgi:hypothetical protein